MCQLKVIYLAIDNSLLIKESFIISRNFFLNPFSNVGGKKRKKIEKGGKPFPLY